MNKTYNTPEYRAAKRVVAFINPKLKKKIEKDAKSNKRSISCIIGIALEKIYGDK